MLKASTGYPPPDENLRYWLLTLNTVNKPQRVVAKILHGFIHSLLLVTLGRLEDIEGSAILYSRHSSQNLTALQSGSI